MYVYTHTHTPTHIHTHTAPTSSPALCWVLRLWREGRALSCLVVRSQNPRKDTWYVCVCVYVCVYACIYTKMNVSLSLSLLTHIHTHTHTPQKKKQGAGGFAGDTLLFSLTDKKKGFTSPLAPETASPSPRGWYAYGATGEGAFVCVGGLAPDNSRLGDVWLLEETKGGAKEEL